MIESINDSLIEGIPSPLGELNTQIRDNLIKMGEITKTSEKRSFEIIKCFSLFNTTYHLFGTLTPEQKLLEDYVYLRDEKPESKDHDICCVNGLKSLVYVFTTLFVSSFFQAGMIKKEGWKEFD